MKNNYLSSSFNSVVSLDMDTSWAAKSWDLSNIYWNQNGNQVNLKKAATTEFLLNEQDPIVSNNFSRGKVRQLFLERRGKGWDRSNPLEPIKTKTKPNRTQGQSPLTKSLSNLPDYYITPELFSIPVRLPNLGSNTMHSQGNESKKVDLKPKSKIPQPRGTPTTKSSFPPTEEIRKLTLSPRKLQGPERTASPAKVKSATPGPSRENSQKGKMTPNEKSNPVQRRQPEASPQSRVTQPTPRTPAKNLDPDMEQCSICGRSFLKDRLKVHEGICKKSTTTKRKVFDPVKHRLAGTEAERYLRKGIPQSKTVKAGPPKAKADWRKKHEEFIATIRAAKQVQDHLAKGGNIRDLPPPPPMDTSDYVQCQHCGRKFNSSVADRHIPICSKIKSNKPQSKRTTKKN